MRSSRNSIRAQLIRSWYIWASLFFFIGVNTEASLGTSAANNYIIFQGRAIQEFPGERGESEKNNRKKDDKLVEKENSTDQPSPSPSYSMQSVTQPPTTSSTAFFSTETTFAKDFVEARLFSFSLFIHGSVSMDDEFNIRRNLQDYLLDYFQKELEQQVDVAIDSVVLEMVQMTESYIPLVKGDETHDKKSEENLDRDHDRRLQYIRRRNGHQNGRYLQSASLTSTSSTQVEYKASAMLLFEHRQKIVVDDVLPALQERQIEALENNGDLQQYFLNWFASVQLVDTGVDTQAEDHDYYHGDHSAQGPVVFMSIQIDERPLKSFESNKTWEAIESILDYSKTSDIIDASSDIQNDNNGVNENKENLDDKTANESRPTSFDVPDQSVSLSNSSKSQRKSTWKIALGIGCALLIVVGFGGMCLFKRDKNHKFDNKIVATPELNEDQLKHDNDNDNDNDESDSVAAKINLYNATANDDDSMMGYSLTSADRDCNRNEGQQEDSKSVEDLDLMSVAFYESDECNPMVAGIHNLLEYHNERNNPAQYSTHQPSGKSQFNDQQDRSQSLLGDEPTTDEQDDSLILSETCDTEYANSASNYMSDESVEGDPPHGTSAFSSDGIIPKDSEFYGKDEIMTTPNKLTSLTSEKMHSASPILPKANIETNPEDVMLKTIRAGDDASDAPSDERNNGLLVASPNTYFGDHTQYTEAIRNSKLLDNDPAVLEYLVNDNRDIENRTSGSQPPLTTEL